MKVSALPYYGGKSYMAQTRTGPWIASLLPGPHKRQTYVEPFAGMLGVLLQRRKVDNEIANDLNEEIVNWWRIVRDRGDELRAKLALTPYSEKEFELAYQPTDDVLECARRTTVKLVVGINSGLGHTSFRPRYAAARKATISAHVKSVHTIQERIKDVALFCRPAEKLLARLVDESHAVIYCDPPYQDADTTPYGGLPFDRGLFTELLQAQTGAVAISGYGEEWDHLGWQRHEHETITSTVGKLGKGEKRPTRVEVLWTNYEPKKPQLTMFG